MSNPGPPITEVIPDGDPRPLLVNREGAVTTLRLNRQAELNAIDRQMALLLVSAVEDVAADPNCRCLVITGEGRAFCAGQSLGTGSAGEPLPKDIEGLIRERYTPLVMGLHRLQVPVVAAVNGLAAGAGLSLALAADVRICSDAAWFSCAFAQIGLVPDSGATYFLPRYLGLGRALHYAISGDRIPAEEALALGLVSRVFPASSFTAEARAFAARLADGATKALAMTKQALYGSLGETLEGQLEVEAGLQQAASGTADFAEGIAAFREKRVPTFRGR